MKLGKQERNRISVKGKFSFKSLPQELQEKVKKRLAEKDPVLKMALSTGEVPGITIGGKVVTQESLREMEINPKKSKKAETKERCSLSEEDLKKMSFSKLKKLANTFGETGRSKSGLIKDILKHN